MNQSIPMHGQSQKTTLLPVVVFPQVYVWICLEPSRVAIFTLSWLTVESWHVVTTGRVRPSERHWDDDVPASFYNSLPLMMSLSDPARCMEILRCLNGFNIVWLYICFYLMAIKLNLGLVSGFIWLAVGQRPALVIAFAVKKRHCNTFACESLALTPCYLVTLFIILRYSSMGEWRRLMLCPAGCKEFPELDWNGLNVRSFCLARPHWQVGHCDPQWHWTCHALSRSKDLKGISG